MKTDRGKISKNSLLSRSAAKNGNMKMLRTSMVFVGVLLVLLFTNSVATAAPGVGFGDNYFQPPAGAGTGNAGDGTFILTWHTWFRLLPVDPEDEFGAQELWYYYAYQLGNINFQPRIGSLLMLLSDDAAAVTIYEGDAYTSMPLNRSDGSVRPGDWLGKWWNRYTNDLAGDDGWLGWASLPGYEVLPGEGTVINPYFEIRSKFAPGSGTFKITDSNYNELVSNFPDPFAIVNVPIPMIPEPGTFGLLALGALGLIRFARKEWAADLMCRQRQ